MYINADQVKAIRGKIFGKVITADTQTKSGLWIARTIKEIPQKLKVISIGPPSRDKKGREIQIDVQAGDYVYFKKRTGDLLYINDEQYVFSKHDNIIAYTRGDDKLRAVRDSVIVKLIYEEKYGSIFVPDKLKQYSGKFHGQVVAVGPKYQDRLAPGDKIVFMRHEGYPLEFENETYLTIQNKWVAGRLDE